MKKNIISMVIFFIILIGVKVSAASGPDIEALINGKVEKGENIQIVINIKEIKSLYAGDIELKYDPAVLKLKGIELGDLISKKGVGKFDAVNKVDEQNGTARYAFSCFGQVNGFSGSGTLIKINAEVLKKETISINSKPFLKAPDSSYNLKLQLCDSDVKELEYTFKPLNPAAGENKPVENKPSENQGTTDNTNNNTSSNNANSNPTSNPTNNTNNSNEGSSAGNNKTDTENANAAAQQNSTEQKPEVNQAGDAQQQNNAIDNTAPKNVEQTKGKNNAAVVIGVIILVLGGAGGYNLWRKKKISKTSSINSTDDVNM